MGDIIFLSANNNEDLARPSMGGLYFCEQALRAFADRKITFCKQYEHHNN